MKVTLVKSVVYKGIMKDGAEYEDMMQHLAIPNDHMQCTMSVKPKYSEQLEQK